MNLEDFTAEALRPHVGSHFHVSGEDGQAVDLLLDEVKVTTHEQHPSTQLARDPFSLFFVGPSQPFLRQSIYTVQHDALRGTWEIFLVPVAQRTGGFLYEAAFT